MKQSRLGRRVLGIATMSSLVAVTFLACSSSGDGGDSNDGVGSGADVDGGTGGSGGSSGSGGDDASVSPSSDASSGSAGSGPALDGSLLDISTDGPQFDPDAFFEDDPPPGTCGGDAAAPAPGGTPECPDDKRREGCACVVDGEQVAIGTEVACWPGHRTNRHHGVCRDGKTTCRRLGESGSAWGPCEGYVLPTAGATSGPAACTCFSQGQWKIDNLSPCFVGLAGEPLGTAGAVSTLLSGDEVQCPPEASKVPLVKPTGDWSPNSLTVDCAGHFELCFTLKAGDAKNPQPSDCVLARTCTEGDYPQEGVETPFPPLPAWAATDEAGIACATQFVSTGGYGEMSVEGLSVDCEEVADHVFNRVPYCKLCCNDGSCPDEAECKACRHDGGGTFN